MLDNYECRTLQREKKAHRNPLKCIAGATSPEYTMDGQGIE